MDLILLRETLAPHILSLKDATTGPRIPELCESLGMPQTDEDGSKRDRIRASWTSVADSDLPEVARRLLKNHMIAAESRIQIQDILWSDGALRIPRRFRRELALSVDMCGLYVDGRKFDELLELLWDLGPIPFFDFQAQSGLRYEIARHVHQHDDWNVETVFDKLGAFEAGDQRFIYFIEGLASADVRPDEAAQRTFVECANSSLRKCGVELRETDSAEGYPVFTMVSLHDGTRGRPKNLVFASSVKPDIRFKDAIDNDIEIVSNADQVLVYDRQIGPNGLCWQDLQNWWAEARGISDPKQAKASLYRRLMASLPQSSPPQKLLFEGFFKAFTGSIPQLPALLPEVWLHWDPKTVEQRGRDALLRFRMDFLLLLPHGVRVVIEVDGKQHYAHPDGAADVKRYAEMVAGDRELKLAGYEVFRFGGAELKADDSEFLVKEFFESLFKRYRVH